MFRLPSQRTSACRRSAVALNASSAARIAPAPPNGSRFAPPSRAPGAATASSSSSSRVHYAWRRTDLQPYELPKLIGESCREASLKRDRNFWDRAFEVIRAVPDVRVPDMASIAIAVSKMDHPGRERLLAQYLGELMSAQDSGGVVFSARDLGHLCVGFAASKDKKLAQRFLKEIATPFLLKEAEGAASFSGSRAESTTTLGELRKTSEAPSGATSSSSFASTQVGIDPEMRRLDGDAHAGNTFFELDANTTARILNSFAKVLNAQTNPKVVEFLAESAAAWIPEMYARELVNVALSLSKVGGGVVVASSSSAISAAAFGKCSQTMHEIRDRIVMANLLPGFNAQDYSNCISAFANFYGSSAAAAATTSSSAGAAYEYDFHCDDHFHTALATSLEKQYKGGKVELLAQHVASLVWSYGRKLQKLELVGFLTSAEELGRYRFTKPQELVNTWTVLCVERPAVARKVLLPQFLEKSSASGEGETAVVSTLKGVDVVPVAEGLARVLGPELQKRSCQQSKTDSAVESRLLDMLGRRCVELVSLRSKGHRSLDDAQATFVLHAFCKLPGATEWVAQLLPPDLGKLDANSLALVLSGLTHHLHQNVSALLAPVLGSSAGVVPDAGSVAVASATAKLRELAHCCYKLVELLRLRNKESPSAQGQDTATPVQELDFEAFLNFFYKGNKNVDRSATNVLQSLVFLSNYASVLGDPDGRGGSNSLTTRAAFLEENSTLTRHLAQIVLQDSMHFSHSTLVQSVYSLAQLQDQLPAGVRSRFLEKLSMTLSSCVMTLRASDCVAAANTLAIANHLDEALLDKLARRMMELSSSATGKDSLGEEAEIRSSADDAGDQFHRYAWQFLASCARMTFHSKDVAAMAQKVAASFGGASSSDRGSVLEAGSVLSSLARLDTRCDRVRHWRIQMTDQDDDRGAAKSADADTSGCGSSSSLYSELLFFGYMYHFWHSCSTSNCCASGLSDVKNREERKLWSENILACLQMLLGRPAERQTREGASQILTGALMLSQVLVVRDASASSISFSQPPHAHLREPRSPTAATVAWAWQQLSTNCLQGIAGVTARAAALCSAADGTVRESVREGDSEGDVMDALLQLVSKTGQNKRLQELATQKIAGPYTVDLCVDADLARCLTSA